MTNQNGLHLSTPESTITGKDPETGDPAAWTGASPQPGDPAPPPGATPLADHVEAPAALARRLEVGVALVNNHALTGVMPETPWTGTRDTGPGVANSKHAYHVFVRRRTLLVDGNKDPDPFWMPANDDLARFGDALRAICRYLAILMVKDGEGAEHAVRVVVEGALDDEEAERVARGVGESALVRTAVYGRDANWGRINQAVGQALARTGGNVTAAAALLGLGRATLYRHLARGR